LDLTSHKVMVSRDVKFEEHIFPFHKSCSQSYMQPTPINMVPNLLYDDMISPNSSDNAAPQQPASDRASPQQPVSAAPSPAVEIRRSTRVVSKPRWMHDFVTAVVHSSHTKKLHYPAANQVFYKHLNPHFQAFLSTLDAQQDPDTFQEAVQHQHWCDAMNIELQALERNGTWSLAKLPKGKRAIGCKWFYKTKFHLMVLLTDTKLA